MVHFPSRRLAAIAILTALSVFGVASADPIIGSPVFHIDATNLDGTASYDGNVGDGTFNPGFYSWFQTPGPLMDGPDTIAMLTYSVVTVQYSPLTLGVAFEVVAGNSTTTFNISSALVSFPAISSAVGSATSAMGISDTGGAAGAALNGLFTGEAYRTEYNSGVIFDTQLGSFSTPGGNVGNADGIAATPIGVPVVDMQSHLSFTLTPGDRASGTFDFTITPEPASALLVALAGLVLVRRRR